MDDAGESALPQRHNAGRRTRAKQIADGAREPGPSGRACLDLSGQIHDPRGTVDDTQTGTDEATTHADDGGGHAGGSGASSCHEVRYNGHMTAERERPPHCVDDSSLPAYRSAAVGSFKFEYLDHTADVQLHAWGRDLSEAFENCALAMFNYMSPLQHVRQRENRTYRAEGHDLPSLLFAFLDELLFVFSTELFLAASLTIKSFDRQHFVIEAEGRGEMFDREVHEVGTEIKAITYSAMSILERADDAEVFLIVDV